MAVRGVVTPTPLLPVTVTSGLASEGVFFTAPPAVVSVVFPGLTYI
jgi:hypothetical protein